MHRQLICVDAKVRGVIVFFGIIELSSHIFFHTIQNKRPIRIKKKMNTIYDVINMFCREDRLQHVFYEEDMDTLSCSYYLHTPLKRLEITFTNDATIVMGVYNKQTNTEETHIEHTPVVYNMYLDCMEEIDDIYTSFNGIDSDSDIDDDC